MTAEVIIVPFHKEVSGPVIFLAGPIQGAPNWQANAVDYMKSRSSDIHIASPRGDYSAIKFNYDAQIDWETKYLNRASQEGVLLFWLAKEDKHDCNRAYAQTTRYELAEWITKHQYNKNIRLSVGIEPGFTGERYIRKRIGQDCPQINIHSSLEETCDNALLLLKSSMKGGVN